MKMYGAKSGKLEDNHLFQYAAILLLEQSC
ncbi:hypothetical protein C8U37_11272 [Trichococcus patagoniensis]|uniref:Uncharacterized protein n=1 Tax=Trichococcus patagoniensis TaxID=382641 RepID=A0A2T5IIZ3_9LACT|nr:hypothetical protein C8U37_11272 [Trichococcus patagoniensis]